MLKRVSHFRQGQNGLGVSGENLILDNTDVRETVSRKECYEGSNTHDWVRKLSASDNPISCQAYLSDTKRERFLSDIQIVGFWVS